MGEKTEGKTASSGLTFNLVGTNTRQAGWLIIMLKTYVPLVSTYDDCSTDWIWSVVSYSSVSVLSIMRSMSHRTSLSQLV